MLEDVAGRIFKLFDNRGFDEYPLKEYTYIGWRGVRRLDGREKADRTSGLRNGRLTAGNVARKVPDIAFPSCQDSNYGHRQGRGVAGRPGNSPVRRSGASARRGSGGHVPNAIPVLPRIAYFQGEEVGACVAADTEAIAEEVLRLIHVDWEERPFVLDAEEGLKPGAPLANPEMYPAGNYYNEGFLDVQQQGDVAQGFAEADVIVEFQCRRLLHTWIGPERPFGVFRWNGDSPEIWVKQQRPLINKRVLSSWFGGISMNRIRVHCPYQGASFGGWSQVPWNTGGQYCAGILAKRTGHPVKWTFARREDFYGGEMDEGSSYFRVGAKKDGTITAVEVSAVLSNQWFPVFGTVTHFLENTKIPNILGKLKAVQINKGINVSTRCEQNTNAMNLTPVFDRVAAGLGMDPTEVELKNDGAEGHDMDWLNERKAEMGFPVRDSLRECIERGKSAIGWDKKWHAPGTRRLPNGRMHGLAFAWTHEWEDSAGSSEVGIRIEKTDGTATIFSMRADCGLNSETVYCQIAADELGMRIEDVHYVGQIDAGFYAMTPDSSTNMSVNGFAVRNAARLLKQKILEAATRPRGVTSRGSFPPAFPGFNPDDLDIKDSCVYVKRDPEVRMTIGQFVGAAGLEGPMIAQPEMGKGAQRSCFTAPLFAYSWQVQRGAYSGARLRLCRQAHFMEVEVDTDTGEIDVVKVVNVNDVGKVISWEGCEGQQYGGTCMGVSRGKTEEVVHDAKTGVTLNGNLLDYKIATILDIGTIDTILVETGMDYGPYGSIGIGEDVATVVPALIMPAVYNAIGVWIDAFPINPDRVLKALGKAS